MAAREAMTRQVMAAEAHQGHGTHGPKEPERKPAQDRHALCPFCFVQAIQILPSASGGELKPPAVISVDQSSICRSAPVVPRQFLTCLHPRAPPHDARA
jgi:hypothetical protein